MEEIADPVAAVTLATEIAAPPADVWRALTCPLTTARWLYGTGLESTWQRGDAVVGRLGGRLTGMQLTGEVLWAQPPAQLSYAFDDGACSTYVSWVLEEVAHSTRVTLTVFGDGDLREVWRPALAALSTVVTAG